MNHKEMIESKTIVIEVKIAFDGLISGLDSAKEKIIEIEIKSIEDSHTGKQRQKKKKLIRMLKNCQSISKHIYKIGILRQEADGQPHSRVKQLEIHSLLTKTLRQE